MKLNSLLPLLLLTFILSLSFTSCGGDRSESSSNYEESSESYGSHSSGYSLSFNNPHAVTAYLSNSTFSDSDGNSFHFDSGATNVYVNGQAMGGAVQVEDFGTDDDGAPYAIFSFSSPYGKITFFLTELDEDYGGRLPSKVVIYDMNDPKTLYFKR